MIQSASCGANYGISNGGGSGSVAGYANGVQNTNNIITNGILGPNAIAIDGAGNIFVQNNYIYVAVYGKAYGFAPPTSLIRTLAPQYPICGIALDNGTFCLRRQLGVQFASERQGLLRVETTRQLHPEWHLLC